VDTGTNKGLDHMTMLATPPTTLATALPGSQNPEGVVDTWPLRGTDPVNVDGYRLLSRLGAGGMADVYLAVAPTGCTVAVKVLRAGAGTPEICRREFLLASTMDASCTAPALGYGTSAAGAYLVTAYLPGYRCATTLLGEPPPTARSWRFGAALARTLAAVHARGVVHCDVKPSNLLIRGSDVRIIDFGIARHVGEPPGGEVVQFSRGWAAPEQLWDTPATPAMDVFAWGCLLTQLASGIHPFASQSEPEWILRVQSAQPDLFGLPPALDDVVRWTLAHDPRDRPSAHALATICGSAGSAHAPPTPRRWREATATRPQPIPDAAALTPTVRLVQRPVGDESAG
jgi:serine/threonine protein kinase